MLYILVTYVANNLNVSMHLKYEVKDLQRKFM